MLETGEIEKMSKGKVCRKLVFGAQILRPPGSMKKKMIFADATPRKEENTKPRAVNEVRLQNRVNTREENKSEGEMDLG